MYSHDIDLTRDVVPNIMKKAKVIVTEWRSKDEMEILNSSNYSIRVYSNTVGFESYLRPGQVILLPCIAKSWIKLELMNTHVREIL